MRKKKKIVIIAIIVTLLCTIFGVLKIKEVQQTQTISEKASEEKFQSNNEEYVQDDVENSSIRKRLTEDSENIEVVNESVEECTYEEGKAIIVYESDNFFTNLKVNTISLFNDYKIEDTIDFGELDIDDSSNSEISVAVVSSGVYSTEELIEDLNEKNWVISAIPNYEFKTSSLTNDEWGDIQWAIQNDGQFAGTAGDDIGAITTSSETEKVIAIIDSGVDYTNEDLADIMWKNPFDEETLPGTCGYDFVNNDNDPMDDYGHGTHCAGIIAAEANNGVGISGAVLGAPNIKIMAIKAGDANGTLSFQNILNAYKYVIQAQELGVNIVAINNSWGIVMEYNTTVPIMEEMVEKLIKQAGQNGAISVISAGNNGLELDEEGMCNSGGKSYVSFPTCIESNYTINVAATDSNDELGYFSNYGDCVDIVAPGVDIFSTYISGKEFNPISSKEYEYCLYEDFEDESSDIIDKIEPYIVSSQNGEAILEDASSICSIEVTDERFYGDSGNSLKILVDNSNKNEEIDIRFPLKDLGVNDFSRYAISLDIYVIQNTGGNGTKIAGYGYTYNGKCLASLENETFNAYWKFGVTNIFESSQWNHWDMVYKKLETVNLDYLDIAIYQLGAGQYTIYIDNIVVTKDLGDDYMRVLTPYRLQSGTSMAAPFVTASVAVASNQYEDYTPLEIKNLILNGARDKEKFTDVVKYGALDMQSFLKSQEIGLVYGDSSYNYDGREHSTNLEVVEPTNGVEIYYSTEQELTLENYNIVGNTTKPMFSDAGEYAVYWYAHSVNGMLEDVSGINKVNIEPIWMSSNIDNEYIERNLTGSSEGSNLIQFKLNNTSYMYTGKEIDAIGVLTFHGKELIKDKDYIVEYYISNYDEENYPVYDNVVSPIDINNIYMAKLIGKGNFKGILSTEEFTIEPRNITIIANEQKILEGNQIKTGVDEITIQEYGLAEGQVISEITLESTVGEDGQEIIKISNAIIKDSSDNDVTSNYNINYVDGKLKTLSKEEIIEIQFNDIGLYKSIILGNNIETLYEDEENKKAIFDKDIIEQLESLVLDDTYGKIADLTGLSSLYNLKTLNIQNSNVKDIGEILELPNVTEVKIDSSCNIEELETDENKMYLPQFFQVTAQTQNSAIITAKIYYGENNETEVSVNKDENGRLYVILDNKVTGSKPAGDRIINFSVSGGITDGSSCSVLYNVIAPLTNFETIEIEEEEYIVIFAENDNSVKNILTRDNFPNTNYEMRAIDINGEILTDNDQITTGTKIEIFNTQEIVAKYNMSVKGDIDSDGFIDLYDILKLIELVFDTDSSYIWDECIRLAGKCVEDSNTQNPDLYDILRLIEYNFDNVKFYEGEN